jgi:hypothetical protein
MARPRPAKSPRQDPIRPANEMVFFSFWEATTPIEWNPAQAPFSPVSAPVRSPEQEQEALFWSASRQLRSSSSVAPAAFGFASQFSPVTDRDGHFTRHPWQQQKQFAMNWRRRDKKG